MISSSNFDWPRLHRFQDGVRLMVAGGPPQKIFRFPDGIGDDLLGTIILREWRRRGANKLWVVTNYPELFERNPDCACVIGPSPADRRMLNYLRCPLSNLTYAKFHPDRDQDDPPSEHIIKIMARQAGLTGQIVLRPYLCLTNRERASGRLAPKQIALQTSGLGARAPMANKDWFPKRFQQVVSGFESGFTFAQLGGMGDPPLDGVVDLRGRTTLRESAAILANSLAFCGLVGGLMHLARAVDCRAAIVYGGRELPSQSGYAENENLSVNPPCSPCWLRSQCGHERVCLDLIRPDEVAAALRRQIERTGTQFSAETVSLDNPSPSS